MIDIFGWARRRWALLSDNRGGPWGSGGGNGGGDDGEGGGPRNPWGPRKRKPSRPGGDVTALDELLKRSRARFGGGFPGGGGRPYWLYALVAFVGLWIVFTSVHRIAPQERGIVTMVGRYTGTLQPGIGFSLPYPLGGVTKVNIDSIRAIDIPGGSGAENLILTGDQNVINLAYQVRWNIKNPQLYLYRLADADLTIREVAESAMRAAMARVSLDDAIGAGRGDIEQRVEQSMQQLLDYYGAGVEIQGVAISGSTPPGAVNDAFLEVSAAQQQAQSYLNDARAYALQQTAHAQGEAGAFERVYNEYRAAPDVTRRRMYYETMERILSRVDTTIIEAPGVTPYLPLPEIQRRALPAPQSQGPAR